MTKRKTKAKPETEFPRLALHDLKPPRGSHRARIRKGRGPGSGIGKTGVSAVLRGSQPGRRLLIRADIDALPIEEESGTAYASRHDGVMHA